jgi:hypothetical protein
MFEIKWEMVRSFQGCWFEIDQGGSTGWYARGTVCGQDVSGLWIQRLGRKMLICLGMHCVELDICSLDMLMYSYLCYTYSTVCTSGLRSNSRGDRPDASGLIPMASAIRTRSLYPSNSA